MATSVHVIVQKVVKVSPYMHTPAALRHTPPAIGLCLIHIAAVITKYVTRARAIDTGMIAML